MLTGGGYMTRPHLIISSGILDSHIQLVMHIPKIIIVVLWPITTVVNGLIIHVASPFRIYVKVIFVSLLFHFVDNIIDLRNTIIKPKTIQLEQFHNPIEISQKQAKYIP